MGSLKQKSNASSASSRKTKRVICYVFAFLIINLYFGNLIYKARAIRIEDLITKTITIGEIHYSRVSAGRGVSTRFWLVADNVKYDIHRSALHENNYTVGSFQEKVAEGDQLTISYFDISPFSQKLVIAEAYNDQGIFLTLDGYNASCVEPRVLAIIFYCLASCLFSFVMLVVEGWLAQWIHMRNVARKKNKRALEEAAKAARRAEREALAAQTNKRASAAKHQKK